MAYQDSIEFLGIQLLDFRKNFSNINMYTLRHSRCLTSTSRRVRRCRWPSRVPTAYRRTKLSADTEVFTASVSLLLATSSHWAGGKHL